MRSLGVQDLRKRIYEREQRLLQRLPGEPSLRPVKAWLTRYRTALAARREAA